MTRINSNIPVANLTDEHLLAEHREIKRLPAFFQKSLSTGSINKIPKNFCLGTGHVTFFLDKGSFTLKRYSDILKECQKRGFNITDYSENWNIYVNDMEYFKEYIPTKEEKILLEERISERILCSSKDTFHYNGVAISKEESIKILKHGR